MKIIIIGVTGFGGSSPLGQALTQLLKARGHNLQVFYYNNIPVSFKLYKVLARFGGSSPTESYTRYLAELVRKEKPDLLISIEGGDILLEDLPKNMRKAFLPQAPMSSEAYFTWASSKKPFDIKRFYDLKNKEIAMYEAADMIFYAWKTYEEFVRKYVYDSPKIISHPKYGWFGCEPQEKLVQYQYPVSIVFLGNLGYYWMNKELLSHLTGVSPYVLDVWGAPKPDEHYHLRYKGIAPTHDVLYDYQFGLVTVSKDLVRRWGWSSKILTYLSHGLPCLFPEWHRCGHELGGCIPYNEKNFNEVVDGYIDRTVWEEKSKEAIEQARELAWPKILNPMIEILESS